MEHEDFVKQPADIIEPCIENIVDNPQYKETVHYIENTIPEDAEGTDSKDIGSIDTTVPISSTFKDLDEDTGVNEENGVEDNTPCINDEGANLEINNVCGDTLFEDKSPEKDIIKESINIKTVIIVLLITTLISAGGYFVYALNPSTKMGNYINLGNNFVKSEKYGEAVLCFEKALRIDPRNIKALLGVAKSKINLKKFIEAQPPLKTALYLDKSNSEAADELAKIYTLQGRDYLSKNMIEESADVFNKITQLPISSTSIFLEISDIYASFGRYGEALKFLQNDKLNTEKTSPKIAEYIKYLPGNTSGNILNKGIAAQSGNFIYYVNSEDKGKIYRMNNDGNGRTKVCDDSTSLFINVLGDYIYYSNGSDSQKIYKIKTDGSNKSKLNDDPSVYVNVIGDWIYYIVSESAFESPLGYKICKIRLDGTERTELANNDGSSIYTLSVFKDFIYYSIDSQTQPGNNSQTIARDLYKIKTDGSGKTKVIEDFPGFYSIYNNQIYYINNDFTMYRTGLDGALKTKAVNELSGTFSLWGNWIFYKSITDGCLYKMKIDGTGKAKLSSTNCIDINAAEDWIFYSLIEDYRLVHYGIKKDGSMEHQIR